MNVELYENINKLNDDEIHDRVKAGFFDEEAYEIAVGILKTRGASVPQVQEGYIKQNIPFRKRHPLVFWTIVSVIGVAISKALIRHIQGY